MTNPKKSKKFLSRKSENDFHICRVDQNLLQARGKFSPWPLHLEKIYSAMYFHTIGLYSYSAGTPDLKYPCRYSVIESHTSSYENLVVKCLNHVVDMYWGKL